MRYPQTNSRRIADRGQHVAARAQTFANNLDDERCELADRDTDKLDELAARGGLSLARTKVYLWDKLRRQAQAGTTYLKRGQITWGVINPAELAVFQAKHRAGLQLADIVASAFGQAIEPKPDGRLLTEYAETLIPKMASTIGGQVADYGLKLMPDPPLLRQIGLSDEQVQFFARFGYNLLGPDP